MKQINFFISLLICLGLMFAVSSCRCIEVEPDYPEPLECAPNVIVCNDVNQHISDFHTLSNVRVEGNNLRFTITASGCNGSSWVVKLITSDFIFDSLPPQRSLRIFFENNEDCLAVISREFAINIECLQVSNPTNSMWFRLWISETEFMLIEWNY